MEEDPNRDVKWHSVAIDIKNTKEGCGLNEDDRKLISESSCLETTYAKSLSSIEDYFFSTIREYGEESLQELLDFHTDGLDIDQEFFIVMRGKN